MNILQEHTNLVEFAKQGQVVLFLGAGASLSAKDKGGNAPPLASGLAGLLSEKFLGGAMAKTSLTQVAECAIADTNTAVVQNYIKEIFSPFMPGKAHRMLPLFSWAGIATTNYDLLVEDAYSQSIGGSQNIKPYVYDDQVKRLTESDRDLPYLKLHGCFNHMGPETVPLVITPEQYLDYEKGRKSLFDTFEEWARRYTFVFVGYGAQDLNVRKYITRLVDNVDDRMRFYFVRPGWELPEKRLWDTRKVTAIDADFDSFMTALDEIIGNEFRGLRIEMPMPAGLRHHFGSKNLVLSENTSLFLQNDAVFVESVEIESGTTPKKFFDGKSVGWKFVSEHWDIVRDVVEDIIIEVFLDDNRSQQKECELILLRGYAGSGKTVALKRLAWELAHEHKGVALYLERTEDLNSAAISEIVEVTGERVYVFINDIGSSYSGLRNCVKGLSVASEMVTFIAGVRTNDWNLAKQRYTFVTIREYELGDLAHREISSIIYQLDKYNCLGELADASPEERVAQFRDKAKRNLLVALYEVTRGKSFEDIISDEYETLVSDEARAVYLTICMLNRLNVPVRATLISRIHSLPYEDFRSRLFSPLEGVVNNHYDKIIRDFVYTARHPYIADMIFRIILSDQNDRFEEYFRVLNMLNMAYQCDEIAFKELVRGRVLNELFSDTEYVERIFNVAESKRHNDPNIFHQRAVFEMRRPGGDLILAQSYIDMALTINPQNSFFKHTAAEILVKRAESTTSFVLRDRLLRKAERVCKALATAGRSSHAKHTLAKIGIARASTYLESNGDSASPSTIRGLIKSAQLDLESSLQSFPGDSYLLDAKAKLAKVIGDSKTVMSSLEEAFKSSPHIGYIAMQLHSCYLGKGDLDNASSVLKKCLEENRTNREVNYTYGKFLMETLADPQLSMLYLKRAFVPGDFNFDAQLRYGRECFRAGNFAECERHFSTVRATRFPPRLGSDTMYPSTEFYLGDIQEIHARYMIIKDVHSGLRLRGYKEPNSVSIFSKVVSGNRLQYRVGVSVYGLRATELHIFRENNLSDLVSGQCDI